MKLFLQGIYDHNTKRGMRWNQGTILLGLALQAKCPGIIKTINSSNIMHLPSRDTLKLKEYNFHSKPGVTQEHVKQFEETYNNFLTNKNINVLTHPKKLGIKWDEIKVQDNIVYHPKSHEILGVAQSFDSIDFLQPIYNMMSDTGFPRTQYILQINIFDIFANFEYSSSYFTSECGMSAIELKNIFEQISLEFFLYNFCVVIMDMHKCNQQFVKLMIGGKENKSLYEFEILKTTSLVSNNIIYFLFDPVHLLKSLRNAWHNSSRKLIWGKGYHITWQYLEQIFKEQNETKQIPESPHLKREAVFLSGFLKMRVNLALQAFYIKTLSAFKIKKQEMDKQNKEWMVDGAIAYIENVQQLLIGTFVNPRNDFKNENAKIYDLHHSFFKRVKSAFNWFKEWYEATKTENKENFLAMDTWIGVKAIGNTFEDLCQYLLNSVQSEHNYLYICPFRFTQNSLESHFGQIRHKKCDTALSYATGKAQLQITKHSMF